MVTTNGLDCYRFYLEMELHKILYTLLRIGISGDGRPRHVYAHAPTLQP